MLDRFCNESNDAFGAFVQERATDFLTAQDMDGLEKLLVAARKLQDKRVFRPFGMDADTLGNWVENYRTNKDVKPETKLRCYTLIKNLQCGRPSIMATLALLEASPPDAQPPMERLLTLQNVAEYGVWDQGLWDRYMPYAQSAMRRKDYSAGAALLTGMLSYLQTDDGKRQAARDMVAQCYARMGGVGLAIDENSPTAPLLQATMYLRLGDERLALDTFFANRKMFDEHMGELPVDFIQFICENLSAAGGDENLEKVEEILRPGW